MCREKHNIYRVWHYLKFQASAGGLGMYPAWIKGDYFIQLPSLSHM